MSNLQAEKPRKSINIGDIYALGSHILICGDSTNPDILRSLDAELRISLVLTDPPYGVDYVNSKNGFDQFKRTHRSIKNDQIQTDEDYANFTLKWIEAVKGRLNNYNSFYIFNSDKMIFALKAGLDSSNFKLSQLLIWAKNMSVIGRLDYQPQHELIAYGWFGKHKFLKSKDKTIIAYPKPQSSKLHPTMKPVGLLRRLILNNTYMNDWVYDPFGGSGSTLIACEHTQRKCLMVELDPIYCQIIISRFEKLTNTKAKFLTKIQL